ncbi:hypothetical protein [Aquimarina longa]|uniref:hypothetical protein n=1 Tax=Aquimarina longa TaxID=1080221 RepID=UPI0007839941|nr:hypothetical protein [Aquimarina longa]
MKILAIGIIVFFLSSCSKENSPVSPEEKNYSPEFKYQTFKGCGGGSNNFSVFGANSSKTEIINFENFPDPNNQKDTVSLDTSSFNINIHFYENAFELCYIPFLETLSPNPIKNTWVAISGTAIVTDSTIIHVNPNQSELTDGDYEVYIQIELKDIIFKDSKSNKTKKLSTLNTKQNLIQYLEW